MTRTKKVRKQKQNGTPKAGKKTTSAEKSNSGRKSVSNPRKKNHKGQASGSRNSLVEKNDTQEISSRAKQDTRLGSKRKINLISQTLSGGIKKGMIPKFGSPIEEVHYIENDKKLQKLLHKLDNESPLAPEDKLYVNTLLNRHKLLCELLGIKPDANEQIVEGFAAEPESLLDELEKEFKF